MRSSLGFSGYNPILLTDGYKLDHRRQYPKHTTRVYSNWTPRGTRIDGQNEVVFFGLQAAIKRYLEAEFERNFFERDINQVVDEYKRRVDAYLGPNEIGTAHIAALHDLGYLPLEFKALPEGTVVPLRCPMFTVENTLPEFFWLTNYFETLLSCALWMPCTSATSAMRIRRTLAQAAAKTGSAQEFVQWQGHDFSFRGMPGVEAAAMSGAGHLLFFTGTDTLPAIEYIEEFYGPLAPDYLIAGSVAATEHSVMCAGGKESELQTFERLLDTYPAGILSVVSDTWDLWKVCTEVLPAIKDRVMARPGKLVIRPDSGNPADIICGDDRPDVDRGYFPDSPAQKGVVQLLWDLFGGTTTSTGHKLLDQHIGCVYGDPISNERAKEITDRLAAKGFAAGNMVYGVGSFTYQFATRDTYGFAMKATWAEIDGEGHDLYKNPVTDSGEKKSAKGRLAVMQGRPDSGKDLVLINQATAEEEAASLLQPVWRDGVFVKEETFDIIRARSLAGIRP